MIGGLEHLSYEDKFTELGLFRLEKEKTEETLLQPSSTQRELINRREIDFIHGLIVIGQGRMDLN